MVKAVITAGGLGTRLLPVTKEIPKELLPLYVRGFNGLLFVKPILQIIFELLYSHGIREFCIVTGRGKRAVEDHFTPNWDLVDYLESTGKSAYALELKRFYEMIEDSIIVWVRQPKPLGFGHAVLMAKPFTGDDYFMLVAGDTVIYPWDFIGKLLAMSGGVITLREVEDPRIYGVAVIDNGRIIRVVEKPREPPSKLAIMPYYILPPEIMDYIAKLKLGVGGEIQLTDGIQAMISDGFEFKPLILDSSYEFADVGTPEGYIKALNLSYRWSLVGEY
ncbi:MAG: sugar phosphate nucleotidyltransferase [Acidilobaceae archaeon]